MDIYGWILCLCGLNWPLPTSGINANSTSEIYLFIKFVTIGDTAGEISMSLSWYLFAGGTYYQHLVLKVRRRKNGQA